MALRTRIRGPRWLAIAPLALGALLALAPAALAARTVYFSDSGADAIVQYSVGAGGALVALQPKAVAADEPRRLAMTPTGTDLYATSDDGLSQYDVAPDGRLGPKPGGPVAAGAEPHSIAVHPAGHSVYATDAWHGKLRQFDVGPDGRLTPKAPAYLVAGANARGVAVRPDGSAVYALVAGGIVVFDVAQDGALTRRPGQVNVASCTLEDLAFTPDGAHLYATSSDGRVFQFDMATDGTPVPASPAQLDLGGGAHPVGIAVAPDGSAAYLAAGGEHARRVLSFAIGPDGQLTPAASAPIGGSAWKLRYLSPSPDGRSLFVAGGDGYLFDLGPLGALAPKSPSSVDLHAARGVVVSPNQAPLARFSATAPGVAGAAVQFDASSAVDSDGSIVRYDWSFGDGTGLPDGGPAPQHVYSSPGSYVVTLVVTDNEGASTGTVFTGGTVLTGGGPRAQASQTIEVAAAAAAPPAEPPAPAQAPRPDLGETLLVEPVSGRVLVREPGARRFVPLEQLEEIPLGSTLDTRRGRVSVSTERRKRGGRVQEGIFYGGLFSVRQRRRDRFVTELVLRGKLTCPDDDAGEARAAASTRRRVWGNGSGRFRTRGRYSSGAVRGTKWLTEDRCDGTLTRVRSGRVAVRDFVLHRTVIVRAGEHYLARPE